MYSNGDSRHVVMKLDFFFDRFSKSLQISNFFKIRRVGTELIYADRQTDRPDEANNCFTQFGERA